jgi:hypothetical protein
LAETRHPEHPVLLAAAQRAREQADHASHAVWDAKGDYHDRLASHFTVAVPNPHARLTELDQQVTAARDRLTRTRARIDQLEQAIHAATTEPEPRESDLLHATPSGDHRPAERGPNLSVSPADPISAVREHWSQDRTARKDVAIQRANNAWQTTTPRTARARMTGTRAHPTTAGKDAVSVCDRTANGGAA